MSKYELAYHIILPKESRHKKIPISKDEDVFLLNLRDDLNVKDSAKAKGAYNGLTWKGILKLKGKFNVEKVHAMTGHFGEVYPKRILPNGRRAEEDE